MRSEFNQYTTNYISGVMSLRMPQKESLEILEDIVNSTNPTKNMDLHPALEIVHSKYPICSNFERNFMSLTFALATGVGKTRLMGAFIAYLYTNHNIKNFFVVAPNTTIYDKLKSDLSDGNSDKYVFKGLGCFKDNPPEIIKDDDYRDRSMPLFTNSARIFIFNIDKFNREETNMRRVIETIGDSFYQYLSSLDDLVLIMDESHHYRAARGLEALNALNPLLGLELTATPFVTNGSRQTPFKNVVYDYPIAKAIAAGYVRTPYAMTRANFESFNFGDEQLDKLMLTDGINYHERIKLELRQYAINNSTPYVTIPKVKPFVLIVCKDTNHATTIHNYICSDEFKDGYYKDKTIMIHSRQARTESDENTRLLLAVEDPENPVEIVIHVNKLKEGWDVNNLYTIIPLRTATSKILREQMVGRGLRLPYGKRTGEKYIDAVMLTAHDKFDDIVNDAEQEDSIFKRENLIKVEEINAPKSVYAQLALNLDPDTNLENAYQYTNIPESEETDNLIKTADNMLQQEVIKHINSSPGHTVSPSDEHCIVAAVAEKLAKSEDLAVTFSRNENPFTEWMVERTREVSHATREKFIPIPEIRYTEMGAEECYFKDFDIDMTDFNHVPVENEVLIQRLGNQRDREIVEGDRIDFEACNPLTAIIDELKEKPEVNYEKDSKLLIKLVQQVCKHYADRYNSNGLRNIVMMYKLEISDRIYNQMMRNFYQAEGLWQEEIVSVRKYNLPQDYRGDEIVDLFDGEYTGNIRSVVFQGIKKGVFYAAKFDSEPELILARILENDNSVCNWFKPKMDEFNIKYNNNHKYNPDFVVETDNTIFLVEVKGENMLHDANVIAKKDSGVRYCRLASAWGEANGYKKWRYLFIPAGEIRASSTFLQLARRFENL